MRAYSESQRRKNCSDSSFTARCTYSATNIPAARLARNRRCGANRRGFLRVSSEQLIADFEAGKKAALARVISIVENHRDGFEDILGTLHPRIGAARRVGLTGPPGA